MTNMMVCLSPFMLRAQKRSRASLQAHMAPVGPGALAFGHVKTFELRETDMNGPVVNADHREAERFLLLLDRDPPTGRPPDRFELVGQGAREGAANVDLADGLRRLMQIEEQERPSRRRADRSAASALSPSRTRRGSMIPRRARSVVR